MQFCSTRDTSVRRTFLEAIQLGLAGDGGLFVPQNWPKLNKDDFGGDVPYPVFAQRLIAEFLKSDTLLQELPALCERAFDFPIPLVSLNENTDVLELFHGPTCSFKDFGARFLAECLSVVPCNRPLTMMVATSGDTGSAVAAAFHQKPNIKVIVLFPEGQITERQEHQITCWGDNVLALAVQGTFDECQHLLKTTFQEDWWQDYTDLSTANSINIGRLLPQVTYYAYASIQFFAKHKVPTSFVVPSGNLGNVTACFWAKMLGFPMAEIALATNANRVVEDYLISGEYQPRSSIATLANAMDVGKPSNFERLLNLYPQFDDFKNHVQAMSVSDEQIKQAIVDCYQQYQMMLCPHTATAFHMRQHLSESPWALVATADPAKFETIVEPLLNVKAPLPAALETLLQRPIEKQVIPSRMDALREIVLNHLR